MPPSWRMLSWWQGLGNSTLSPAEAAAGCVFDLHPWEGSGKGRESFATGPRLLGGRRPFPKGLLLACACLKPPVPQQKSPGSPRAGADVLPLAWLQRNHLFSPFQLEGTQLGKGSSCHAIYNSEG